MAFQLDAIVNGGTLSLSDGDPFSFEILEGIGIASTRRLTERGPQQHGDTDIGMRLDPRNVTLSLNFFASSGSALDAHRDTLRSYFKPTVNTPVSLRVTRDDGEVRQIDTFTTGLADIPLTYERRPGNMHKATFQLRAADPLFYAPTQNTISMAGTSLADWEQAALTIGTANILDHVESPSQGQAWTDNGTITAGNPWTVVFRSGKEAFTGTAQYAFSAGDNEVEFRIDNATQPEFYNARWHTNDGRAITGFELMAEGTHNYFMVMDGTAGRLYRDNVQIGNASLGGTTDYTLVTTGGKWRERTGASSQWVEELPRAAIYDIALSANQRANLNITMAGTTGIQAETQDLVYDGDFEEYPIITINGPISDPLITNITTNEKLDFTGITLAENESIIVDLRYGNKQVYDLGGDNRIDDLSTDSNLETWHIAPNPEAAGGTNVIQLAGTAPGTAFSLDIDYYDRYTGF